MMGANFTQAPWSMERDGSVVMCNEVVGTLAPENASRIEIIANARLIAAAPELLAALQAIELGCSFPADDVQRACRDRA